MAVRDAVGEDVKDGGEVVGFELMVFLGFSWREMGGGGWVLGGVYSAMTDAAW